jgi:hypothetical protein
LISVKCLQHEAQGFFLAVYNTKNGRLCDGLVALRILEVARDTEFGIDRNTYLRGVAFSHMVA